MSTCAALIAAVDRMKVGEWSLESAKGTQFKGLGQPIAANSKRSFLHALRRFFTDFELWGWGRLKFSPDITWPRHGPWRLARVSTRE